MNLRPHSNQGGVGIQLHCPHVGGGSHFENYSGANYPLNYTGVKMMHLGYRRTIL